MTSRHVIQKSDAIVAADIRIDTLHALDVPFVDVTISSKPVDMM